MNNIFAILELCAFYMEYKNAKLTEISFGGRNNVKYFLQTQLLRFSKDTAKVSSLLLKTFTNSTHFLLAKRKIPILWTELKQIKYKKSQHLASKHRAVKNLEIAKTFSKNVDKEAT